jgi:hypothetical protein
MKSIKEVALVIPKEAIELAINGDLSQIDKVMEYGKTQPSGNSSRYCKIDKNLAIQYLKSVLMENSGYKTGIVIPWQELIQHYANRSEIDKG